MIEIKIGGGKALWSSLANCDFFPPNLANKIVTWCHDPGVVSAFHTSLAPIAKKRLLTQSYLLRNIADALADIAFDIVTEKANWVT